MLGLISIQVKVEFGNGIVFNLSAEFLRVHSPAVDAKIRSIAGEKVTSLINPCCYHNIENRMRKLKSLCQVLMFSRVICFERMHS